jgi:hypothetical protein
MVSLWTLLLPAVLGVFPAFAQQLRFPSATPNANPLDKAIHSFVMQNAHVPVMPPSAVPAAPVRLTPRKMVAVEPRTNSGKCSIPLINALAGKVRPNELRMPTYRPGGVGPMPLLQPPAPPCRNWPPK